MLVGIAGLQGSGKDTFALSAAAAILAEGTPAVIDRFAAPLKASAAAALGVPEEFLEEIKRIGRMQITFEAIDAEDGPEWLPSFHSITVRQYLQNYGTEAHRDIFGDSFWVEQLVRRYHDELISTKHVRLVCDLRFQNEAEAILAEGGRVVVVNRPGLEADGHPSEDLSWVPHVARYDDRVKMIENAHTLDDFHESSARFARKHLLPV